MNTLFQNSLLFLISTSLLSGCVQAPKQSASNANIPAKPYTAPLPPKKISVIPGNAITNIVAGNTLDKLPAYNIRAGGGTTHITQETDECMPGINIPDQQSGTFLTIAFAQELLNTT